MRRLLISLLFSVELFAQAIGSSYGVVRFGGGGSPVAASNVTAGTFGAGNYVFPANVTIETTRLPFQGNITPSVPTPTFSLTQTCGVACTGTTYIYVVSANGLFSTTSITQVTGSPAFIDNIPALSVSNFNTITTSATTNSQSCNIYRAQAAGGGSVLGLGLIGTVTCGSALNDTGLTATGGNNSWPTRNTTGPYLVQPYPTAPGLTVEEPTIADWNTTYATLPVFQVHNPNNASGGPEFAVLMNGGVRMKEYLVLGQPGDGAGSMLSVASDLGNGGKVLYLEGNNGFNNRLIQGDNKSTGTPVTTFILEDTGAIFAGAASFSSVTDSGLTSGRITYAGASGILKDISTLTFNDSTGVFSNTTTANPQYLLTANFWWAVDAGNARALFGSTNASHVDYVSSNAVRLRISDTGPIRVAAALPVCWTSTGDATGTCDTGLSRLAAGSFGIGTGAAGSTSGSLSLTGITAAFYSSSTNCSNGASPAVCVAASAGSVALPTGVTTVSLVVNTTAVTANSEISLTPDDSVTIAGTTCNNVLATLTGGLAVTARTPGTSFTITYNGTIATNPLCVSYKIMN